MYSSVNVDVLSLVVWGPNQVLQPSHQAHLIIKESNMSSNKRASKDTAGSEGSKKKKQHQFTLFLDDDEVLRGLNKAHKEKCLLIPAKVLYSFRVPFGQEDYLFQYSVLSVNKDHKTLVIQYDERCIFSSSDAFQDFSLHDENEETINNYQIKHLKEHHELYNIHLGRVNKRRKIARQRKQRRPLELRTCWMFC
jgi:hypothetical protein